MSDWLSELVSSLVRNRQSVVIEKLCLNYIHAHKLETNKRPQIYMHKRIQAKRWTHISTKLTNRQTLDTEVVCLLNWLQSIFINILTEKKESNAFSYCICISLNCKKTFHNVYFKMLNHDVLKLEFETFLCSIASFYTQYDIIGL